MYSRAACRRSKRPTTDASVDGALSSTKARTWRADCPGTCWDARTSVAASKGRVAPGAIASTLPSMRNDCSTKARSTAVASASPSTRRWCARARTSSTRPLSEPSESGASTTERPSSETAESHASSKASPSTSVSSAAPSGVIVDVTMGDGPDCRGGGGGASAGETRRSRMLRRVSSSAASSPREFPTPRSANPPARSRRSGAPTLTPTSRSIMRGEGARSAWMRGARGDRSTMCPSPSVSSDASVDGRRPRPRPRVATCSRHLARDLARDGRGGAPRASASQAPRRGGAARGRAEPMADGSLRTQLLVACVTATPRSSRRCSMRTPTCFENADLHGTLLRRIRQVQLLSSYGASRRITLRRNESKRRRTLPPGSATTSSPTGSARPATGRRSTTSSSSRASARARCCATAPTSTPKSSRSA